MNKINVDRFLLNGLTSGLQLFINDWSAFEQFYIDTNSLDASGLALIELHYPFLEIPEVCN